MVYILNFPGILTGEENKKERVVVTVFVAEVESRMYFSWIECNVDPMESIGGCTLFTRIMQKVFPELVRVEGYVRHKMTHFGDWSCGEYHEWLETPDGVIVDPTRAQFDLTFGDRWEYIRENS